MRDRFTAVIEAGRVLTGDCASPPGARYGSFRVRCPASSTWLVILASDGQEWEKLGLTGTPWEHVSASNIHRCPAWEEMCWVKDQFWRPQECVIQYHPPEVVYVNRHPYCLHLWLPVGLVLPMPPLQCV